MFSSTQFHLDDQVFPSIFKPSDFSDSSIFNELYHNSEVSLLDKLDDQVAELVKVDNPTLSFTKEELSTRVSHFFVEHDRSNYGNWVYFPWKKVLVRLLPEEDFIRVRTARNNYKITPQEQQELRKKKVGIIGLSVGQSIAFAIALERGCGELRLADFDTLELSNLNRIKAGVVDLGVEKVILAAREIFEIDPYLKVTLYRKGVNEDNIDDFLSDGGDLDLLIDECDSLDVKVLARERAKAKKIPVLMETSDRGMLDVERFDREPSREIFHGLLGDFNFSDLKNLTSQQKVPVGLKIIGLSTISTRMKVSLLELSQSISSWPQLASAVYLGGATVANASRKLLLGENVESGRYYVDLDGLVLSKGEKQAPDTIKIPYSDYDFIDFLPKTSYVSNYKISKQDLIYLIGKANTAPSGGNSQPWKWIYDQHGVLHLLHDKSKSESLLDYLGTGSLLAFGAALQNFELVASSMGIALTIHEHIQNFGEELIASIEFDSKSNEPVNVPNGDLVDGIDMRCTNRKNADRVLLEKEKLEEFQTIASSDGVNLEIIDDLERLRALTPIVGGMDRLRLLHDQGYEDFVSEIRWSEEEALATKDGIDIATLEMGKSERAAVGLVRDPGTIEFFRKNDLGYGLTKISDQTILSASAVLMFTADKYTPGAFLKAGAAIQRVWIKANLSGYSFQPISASLFVFHRVLRETVTGFTENEKRMILQFKNDLNQIFNKNLSNQEVFMVRINKASEPSMRAFRRDVSASLIFL
ncbi:Rv1355c family protein [Algoriphagus yeomjeoni]|uniref:ThiF family protein n=1 Tax=Algoriphagus yeomjeoni TaxID=291403 RepID=A0A327P2X5_9BACT|nr:Rv1355c family protein [Algoriphagus yeomjeoni]RAI86033.1 ThiF family protein [Algoriphagus yeomjeoni]